MLINLYIYKKNTHTHKKNTKTKQKLTNLKRLKKKKISTILRIK